MSILLKKEEDSFIILTIGDVYDFIGLAFKYIRNEAVISYKHHHYYKNEPGLIKEFIESQDLNIKTVIIIYHKYENDFLKNNKLNYQLELNYILICIDDKSVIINTIIEKKKIEYNGVFFEERIAQLLITIAIYTANHYELAKITKIVMKDYIMNRELLTLQNPSEYNQEKAKEGEYLFDCVFCKKDFIINSIFLYRHEKNIYHSTVLNNSMSDKYCFIYRIRLYRFN